MSEPVTSAEVEDVLSSIRRLVSEDKRPMQATNSQETADRLVLTPALRVAEESDPPEANTPQANSPDPDAQAPELHETLSHDGLSPDPADDAPDADDRTLNDDAQRDISPPEAGDGASEQPSIESLVTDDHALDVYGDGEHTIEEDLRAQTRIEEMMQTPQVRADDIYGFDSDDADYDEEDDSFLLKSVLHSPEPVETAPAEPRHEDHQAAPASEGTTDEDRDADQRLSEDMRQSLRDAIARDEAREAAKAENAAAPQAAMPDIADPEEQPEQSEQSSQAEEVAAIGASDPLQELVAARTAEPVAEETPARTITLSSKIAALETAIGQISDTWEPDDPGDSDYAGEEPEAMEWQDDVETDPAPSQDAPIEVQFAPSPVHKVPQAEPVEEPEPTAVTPVAEPFAAARQAPDPAPEPEPEAEPAMTAAAADDAAPELDLAAEEQLLDEDALRDLISEIVRSELQGALGERITRNVRKLVRREIHRALSAQDLD